MKQGALMGGRALMIYLMGTVLTMLVALGISEEWYPLQLCLNAALLLLMGTLLFADGGSRGERACTLLATMERMRAEGKTPEPEMLKKGFDPKSALVAWLIAALPLLILATVNLVTEPFYPPVLIESAAVSETARSSETADELTAVQAAETAVVNWPNVIARVAFMPVIAAYRFFNQNPHGLNWLFLIFAALYPLPQAVGYFMGPRLRVKKLEAIQKGKKRKMKNLKVNRARKPPKMEV